MNVIISVHDYCHSKPKNRMISSLPNIGHSSTLFENSSNICLYLFSIQKKTVSRMCSCYSGDRIARDHIHTNITTWNIEEPQQKHRIGTGSNRLQRVEGLFFSKPRSLLLHVNVYSVCYIYCFVCCLLFKFIDKREHFMIIRDNVC